MVIVFLGCPRPWGFSSHLDYRQGWGRSLSAGWHAIARIPFQGGDGLV